MLGCVKLRKYEILEETNGKSGKKFFLMSFLTNYVWKMEEKCEIKALKDNPRLVLSNRRIKRKFNKEYLIGLRVTIIY